MLIACPECAHEVSDRAPACPTCGFPISEHVAEQRAAEQAEQERTSRSPTGSYTDCQPCEGRGFRMIDWTDERGQPGRGFTWCESCRESGRLPVVESPAGFFAVAVEHVDAFVAGELPTSSAYVTALGSEAPPPPTYPAPGLAKPGPSSS